MEVAPLMVLHAGVIGLIWIDVEVYTMLKFDSRFLTASRCNEFFIACSLHTSLYSYIDILAFVMCSSFKIDVVMD